MYAKDKASRGLRIRRDIGHLAVTQTRGLEWAIFGGLVAVFGGLVVALHWNRTASELSLAVLLASLALLLVPAIYGAMAVFPARVLVVELSGTFVIVERRWLGIPITRLELPVDDLRDVSLAERHLPGKVQQEDSGAGCLFAFILPFPFNLLVASSASSTETRGPPIPVYLIRITRQDGPPVLVLPTLWRDDGEAAVAEIHAFRPELALPPGA